LTVASPDAPLWQIGGFTFGRFGEPDGRVARARPTLLAWLTNNYWSTNFQADQGGQIRFRFTLLAGPRRPLGESAQAAIARAQPLAAHVYAERGPVRAAAGTLLRTELGELLLTRLEAEGEGVALTLLNPSDAAVTAKIAAGTLAPKLATFTSLAGEEGEGLTVRDGVVAITVDPRAWVRVSVHSK
jgi:hypothetical protein